MTQSFTTTGAWTYTTAEYVARKVAADLIRMQQVYGEPDDARIEKYLTELAVLLDGGYVKEVTYGYRRNGAWIVALRYTADMSGALQTDDRSGRIPMGVSTDGAWFGSFLEHSKKWDDLLPSQRQTIEAKMPFQRSGGESPTVHVASWISDKSYAAGGCGLRRTTIGGAR